MAMAIVQMFWGAVVIGFNMWFTCRQGLRPWTGWADVHYNFSRVGLFPTLLFPPQVLLWTYFAWWTIPISSGLFFIFFAFGQDAVKEYGACFAWVRSKTFRHHEDEKVSSALRPALRSVHFGLVITGLELIPVIVLLSHVLPSRSFLTWIHLVEIAVASPTPSRILLLEEVPWIRILPLS